MAEDRAAPEGRQVEVKWRQGIVQLFLFLAQPRCDLGDGEHGKGGGSLVKFPFGLGPERQTLMLNYG